MNFKIKLQRAVSMIEFAIAAPVLFCIILGMIDLFTYLYLANILEARAHRALEVASWVPHLSSDQFKTDESGTVANSEFNTATEKIFSAALEGEISSIFSTESNGAKRAKLRSNKDDIWIIPEDISEQKDQGTAIFNKEENVKHSFTLLLPKVDPALKSRDRGFSRQPIGVRINAELKPLTPFLPPLSVKGEAWGFREEYSTGDNVPLLDCRGRVFRPDDLPTERDCNCGDRGIDKNTGQCGCPPGKVWGIPMGSPAGTEPSCICDVKTLSCHSGQLYDYENCKCGDTCSHGNHPIYGQQRQDDNKCGCKEGQYFVGKVPGVNGEPPISFKDSNGVTQTCSYDNSDPNPANHECKNLGNFTRDGLTETYYECKYKPECANKSVCRNGNAGGPNFNNGLCGCYCTGNRLSVTGETCPVYECNWEVNDKGYTQHSWGSGCDVTGDGVADGTACGVWQCGIDYTVNYGARTVMIDTIPENNVACKQKYCQNETVPSECKCECAGPGVDPKYPLGFQRVGKECCAVGKCQDPKDQSVRDVRNIAENETTLIDQNANGNKACLCYCAANTCRDKAADPVTGIHKCLSFATNQVEGYQNKAVPAQYTKINNNYCP